MPETNLLVTCGFPRSGNHFLNQSLSSLYYTKLKPQVTSHRRKDFEKYDRIIMPLRNPIESIASSHTFAKSLNNLDLHFKFYLYFHTFALKHKQKIVIMKFEQFTTDIDYIKTQVLENFQIKPQNEVSIEEIKNSMLNHDESYFLPRNNKDELDRVKGEILASPYFDECLELYTQLESGLKSA